MADKKEKSKQEKIDEIHEEIAAYLDGELDAEGVKRVERRLAKNSDSPRS